MLDRYDPGLNVGDRFVMFRCVDTDPFWISDTGVVTQLTPRENQDEPPSRENPCEFDYRIDGDENANAYDGTYPGRPLKWNSVLLYRAGDPDIVDGRPPPEFRTRCAENNAMRIAQHAAYRAELDPAQMARAAGAVPGIVHGGQNATEIHRTAHKVNVDELLSILNSDLSSLPESRYADIFAFLDTNMRDFIRDSEEFSDAALGIVSNRGGGGGGGGGPSNTGKPNRAKYLSYYERVKTKLEQISGSPKVTHLIGRCLDFAIKHGKQPIYIKSFLYDSCEAYYANSGHRNTISCLNGIIERSYLSLINCIMDEKGEPFDSLKRVFGIQVESGKSSETPAEKTERIRKLVLNWAEHFATVVDPDDKQGKGGLRKYLDEKTLEYINVQQKNSPVKNSPANYSSAIESALLLGGYRSRRKSRNNSRRKRTKQHNRKKHKSRRAAK